MNRKREDLTASERKSKLADQLWIVFAYCVEAAIVVATVYYLFGDNLPGLHK